MKSNGIKNGLLLLVAFGLSYCAGHSQGHSPAAHESKPGLMTTSRVVYQSIGAGIEKLIETLDPSRAKKGRHVRQAKTLEPEIPPAAPTQQPPPEGLTKTDGTSGATTLVKK